MPWNFPLLIACWKVAPGAGGGQHRRAQAGVADAAHRAALGELRSSAGCPPGVLKSLPGAGVGHRRRRSSPHPRVAKISFTGSTAIGAHHAAAAAGHQARLARAGRQVARHRLRRRRPRPRADGAPMGGVRQRRPGLLRAAAASSSSGRVRRFVDRFVARAPRRSASATRSTRHPDGPARLGRQRERSLRFLEPAKAEGARGSCGGEPAAATLAGATTSRPTVLVDVDTADAHRARGDLRPGRLHPPVRRRGRGGRASPTTATTACRARCGPATSAAPCASRGARDRRALRELALERARRGALRRLQAERLGRELGMAALEAYSELKSVFVAHR